MKDNRKSNSPKRIKFFNKRTEKKLIPFLSLVFFLFFASYSFAAEVHFQWGNSSGVVDGYKIYYGYSHEGPYPYLLVEVGGTTTDYLATLNEGQEYYLVVRAYNNYGESGNSNEIKWPSDEGDSNTLVFGDASGADYQGSIQDTFININDGNSVGSESLNTYTWPADQVANAIILKANLAVIPYGAQVQSATLYLYMNGMGGGGGDDLYEISVHEIINYNPDLSQCTGYTYDGTNAWTPNGSCYDNIPLAQSDIAAAEDIKSIDKTYGYKTWNVTNMVRDWIANPSMNFGLLLNSDSSASSDSNRFFASSEASDVNQRPKLVVTYTTDSEVNVSPTINSFTGVPSSLNNPGETTTFNVSATDPDGDSLTYTISFGDGTANGSGSQVVHTYEAGAGEPPHIYTATVTVSDGHGHSVAESLQVTVDDIPPTEPENVSSN